MTRYLVIVTINGESELYGEWPTLGQTRLAVLQLNEAEGKDIATAWTVTTTDDGDELISRV